MNKSLFTVLQTQAKIIGWNIRKRHDGYLLQNGKYGGFLCSSLSSLAEELGNQFERIIDEKDWAINKLMDEMKELNKQLEGK